MAGSLHPVFLLEEAAKLVGLVDAHGHSLIPNNVLYSWAVIAILVFFGWRATRNISLVPKGAQNFFEFIIGSLEDFVVAIWEKKEEKYFLFWPLSLSISFVPI